jgi:hypothetical protein
MAATLDKVLEEIQSLKKQNASRFDKIDRSLLLIDKRLSLIEQRLGNIEPFISVDNKKLEYKAA